MLKKFKGNQPFLVMVATVLLFGAAIGYNKLRINHFLAEKKVLPEGIPELREHNQSQGNLTLETVELNRELASVLGSTDEENIANVRLKILNATKTPGLAGAAKKFLTEVGFASIAIGNAPEATDSPTLIRFHPETEEWARFIHSLIGKGLEVELSEIEREASPGAELSFDIVIILTTGSALFEPYLPQ